MEALTTYEFPASAGRRQGSKYSTVLNGSIWRIVQGDELFSSDVDTAWLLRQLKQNASAKKLSYKWAVEDEYTVVFQAIPRETV